MSLLDSQNLRTILEAAYWDRKLTKSVIDEFNIKDAVMMLTEQKNLCNLRVSGCLLLGTTKIANKKGYLILDLAEKIESGIKCDSYCAVETFRSNRILDIGPAFIYNKSAISFNPHDLVRYSERRQKTKNRVVLFEQVQDEVVNISKEEEEYFGVSNSFLEDIELAKRWVDEDSTLSLPQKRKKLSAWENLITDKYPTVPEILPDPQLSELQPLTQPETEFCPKVKPKKNHKKVKSQEPVQNISVDPSTYAMLDCTSDITKNVSYVSYPNFVQNVTSNLFLYQPVIPDMALGLVNLFTSNLKINKIKAALYKEEPEQYRIVREAKETPVKVEESDPVVIKEETKPIEEPPIPQLPKFWSLRTLKMLKLLQFRFNNKLSLSLDFLSLSQHPTRRALSIGFYELLQLSQKDLLLITQAESSLKISALLKLFITNFN